MIQPKMFAVVVIFVGCMQTQIDALTLTTESPFQEGSVVKIKCVMPSYNGQMTWKYNSIEVARCTPDNCLATNSGEGGAFIFAFDISNKIFTWTIVTVSTTHHNKLFECIRDNTDTGNFTASVLAKDPQTVITKSEKRLWNGGFGLSIVDLVAWIVLLISILCFICGLCHPWCYKRLERRMGKKPENVSSKQTHGSEHPSNTEAGSKHGKNPTEDHRGNERHSPPNNQPK